MCSEVLHSDPQNVNVLKDRAEAYLLDEQYEEGELSQWFSGLANDVISPSNAFATSQILSELGFGLVVFTDDFYSMIKVEGTLFPLVTRATDLSIGGKCLHYAALTGSDWSH